MNFVTKIAKGFLILASVFYLILGITIIVPMGFLVVLGVWAGLLGLAPIRLLQLELLTTATLLYLQMLALVLSILGMVAIARINKNIRWVYVWYGIVLIALIMVADNISYTIMHKPDDVFLRGIISIAYLVLISASVVLVRDNARRHFQSDSQKEAPPLGPWSRIGMYAIGAVILGIGIALSLSIRRNEEIKNQNIYDLEEKYAQRLEQNRDKVKWKTYENSYFKIQYPEDWRIQEGSFEIGADASSRLSSLIIDSPEDNGLKSWSLHNMSMAGIERPYRIEVTVYTVPQFIHKNEGYPLGYQSLNLSYPEVQEKLRRAVEQNDISLIEPYFPSPEEDDSQGHRYEFVNQPPDKDDYLVDIWSVGGAVRAVFFHYGRIINAVVSDTIGENHTIPELVQVVDNIKEPRGLLDILARNRIYGEMIKSIQLK